jgi:hypothetical protein
MVFFGIITDPLIIRSIERTMLQIKLQIKLQMQIQIRIQSQPVQDVLLYG